MTRSARRLVLLLLATCLAGVASAGADEAGLPRAWTWLEEAEPIGGLFLSPLLEDAERVQARTAARSVLALALVAPGAAPDGAPIVGAGVIVRRDGLVAASWQVLSRTSRTRWLWARDVGGRWMRAIPMGSTWWGDVGLCRLVAVKRRFRPVRRADPEPAMVRRSFVAVGAGAGRALVAGVGRLTSLVLFDARAKGGRRQIGRASRRRLDETTPVLGLLFEDALALAPCSGTPVFDPETGACLGLVSATDRTDGREERVLVRPWSFLEPFLLNVRDRVVFDPPDLGFAWGPPPRRHGAPAVVPVDLERARETAPGGLLVASVLPGGPSNRVLWEGDVVLEIEGRPVFGEIYESVALALMRLHPGVPTDVVVLRGGERRALQVGTRRARELYPDFDRRHARAAGALPRVP